MKEVTTMLCRAVIRRSWHFDLWLNGCIASCRYRCVLWGFASKNKSASAIQASL